MTNKKIIISLATVCFIGMFTGCQPKQEKEVSGEETNAKMKKTNITMSSFGALDNGTKANLYTLTNGSGMEVKITNYGGVVTSIKVPDNKGNMEDVVLGYDKVQPYKDNSPYFGAIVGRYGNRIAKGKFSLDGQEYTLAVNNGKNALHGGLQGFDKVVWKADTMEDGSLHLGYTSKDMEEGYPGNLKVDVIYTLTEDNELKIDYEATTDKKTVVNLTNHSYFNLAGAGEGDILNHLMMIKADKFTPVDEGLIPTGELKPVEDTPFDFRESHAIGERINEKNEQLKRGGGYDHNFVLNDEGGDLSLAARVEEPTSGRVMEVYTTEPGIQFYSGNFLDGSNIGKGDKAYQHRYGFCLETQHFPDSPNHPDFPSTVLEPGDKYVTTTIYKFKVNKGNNETK